MENENNEVTVWDDMSEIQPEGGLTEADIFGSDDFDDGVLDELFADSADGDTDETACEEAESKTDGATETAPTTEQTDDATLSDDKETAPTTEQETESPKKLKFIAKIDRKEREVEVDESELPNLYQKAQDFDRLSRKYEKSVERNKAFAALAAQLGYESPEAMIEESSKADRASKIEALVNGGTPQEIAEDFIDRKIKTAKDNLKDPADDEDDPGDETGSHSDQPTVDSDKEYYKAQVADFFRARPDLKGKVSTLPKEVSEALILRKGSLRELYAEWEAKQQKADAEKIRKEKELFAQQADAASRAPVRKSPESKSESSEKPDLLREAFRKDMDW